MSKNYTYIKCEDCARRGTPRCRRKGYKWSSCVIPGCMIDVEDEVHYRKSESEVKE